MKIRSLAVNQFKKFTSPKKLEDIKDGLNVVVGSNEMGKSTLLDALRAVLFEKYDSNVKAIKDLQNERNKAGPVVELKFELEDGLYSISKRFVKKPYARLNSPDGSTLEGKVAEEKLRDLLDFSKSGRSGADSETLGMWNILWVKQGESFGSFNLSSSARANLHNALESEVGTVLGGRRGREIPQSIEDQLRKLLTQGGKSRGDYQVAINQVTSLEKELEELKKQKTNLLEMLKNLEEEQGKRERLSDPKRDEEDKAELERARNQLDELEKLENQIEAENRELKVCEFKLKQAEQNEKLRHDLKDNISLERQRLEELNEKNTEAIEQEKQALASLEKLSEEMALTEEETKETENIASRKKRIFSCVELKRHINSLTDQLEKAENAEKRRVDAQKRAEVIDVTQEVFQQIEDAEKERDKAENRLGVVSTLVTFDMENTSGIEVDGASLDSGKSSLKAVSPMKISIPERGDITIEPAVRNHDELIDQQRKAEKQLKDALNKASVLSAEQARTLYNERQKALEQAELARKEAEMYAPGSEQYQPGVQALNEYVEKEKQELENKMVELAVQELPEYQDAKTDLENAQNKSETARESLDKIRATIKGPESILTKVKEHSASTKTRYEECEKRLENLLDQLTKAEDEYSEDRLREETKKAQKAFLYQEDKVEQLSAKRIEDVTVEQTKARVHRLEKAYENKKRDCHKLEISIQDKLSRVDILGGEGLDESIERKKRDLEHWKEKLNRFEREAQVLTLLLETLRNAEQKAKELFLSPVTDRMQPYLQSLFPGSEITIDEDLRIKGVIREAGYEEPFPLLSMGTQEQVAVLVRLAFAEMLVEQGKPATVVLDDALVFSDDTRMDRMFDILNHAADKVQILIFTCREQLFENVGGHMLSLGSASLEELISA